MFPNGKTITFQFKEITPQDVAELSPEARKSVQFIDVREPHEWTGDLGHIPEAQHLPLGQLLLQGPPRTLDPRRPVVLVCRSGARSARAAAAVASAGHRDAYNLQGGMIAWNKANLDVTYEEG